jgi:hypothetical protein
MPYGRPGEPGTGCKRGCLHRQLVRDYRDARDAQEERARKASRTENPNSEEMRAFYRDGSLPAADESEQKLTFKDWLLGHTRRQ